MTMYYTTSAWLPMSNGLSMTYDSGVSHKKKTRDDVNWSSKYLTSDHHDDRLTHNLEQYHIATGRQHPGRFMTASLMLDKYIVIKLVIQGGVLT